MEIMVAVVTSIRHRYSMLIANTSQLMVCPVVMSPILTSLYYAQKIRDQACTILAQMSLSSPNSTATILTVATQHN